MRDASRQLSLTETVTVWMAGQPWPRRVVTIVGILPVVAVFASFQRYPVAIWWALPLWLTVTMVIMERFFLRTELTATENMRVTEAQLTGRSTGDLRLDGWAAHRAARAVERQAGSRWRPQWTPFVMGVFQIGVVVTAAVRAGPWWLLCLLLVPLSIAPTVAYTRSDPDLALELLVPDVAS